MKRSRSSGCAILGMSLHLANPEMPGAGKRPAGPPQKHAWASLTERGRFVCSLLMRLAPLACLFLVACPALAQTKAKPKKTAPPVPARPANSPWGEFVEQEFPFFSSVLDAREAGAGLPKDNLTPRGLILNLGRNVWACLDTDLVRLACVWEGKAGEAPVTPEALAPGSYHIAGQKTKDGQDFLPKPVGRVWLANGIYPGWQIGKQPSFTDPREPAPSPEEVGRGGLPPGSGQLARLNVTPAGLEVVIRLGRHHEAVGTLLQPAEGLGLFRQTWELPAHEEPLILHLGTPFENGNAKLEHNQFQAFRLGAAAGQDAAFSLQVNPLAGASVVLHRTDSQHLWLEVPPSKERQAFEVAVLSGRPATATEAAAPAKAVKPLWPQSVTVQGARAADGREAYVLDTIPLPVPNPWKRNVRLADLAFLNDRGDAAGVTFDGDVWLISGLKGDLEKVTWKRFASGLHEPMNIAAKPVEGRPLPDLYVFDRSGLWKLVDSDGDREADRYEMFCNLFGQTAETREFPNTMKLGPGGDFYLAKGGQEGTTRGRHNGTVLKVAADGQSFEVLGHGLRQPFIGVHPETGLVTASDQQGNYVPSTPLHIIEKNRFYGHLPVIAPQEQYPAPIAEPAAWIPHPVNPSGASQVWLLGARMGPINGELIHLGYNRPELFRVMLNHRFRRPQAAVMSFNRDLDFGPLNAKVNPADGQLYIAGFQVWGTTAKKLSGLARLRHTGQPRVLLKEVTPTDQGLILRFNAKLDPKLATDPANFNAERWNYRRTHEYGSPHLKPDGGTGQEWLTPSSAYLSRDGLSVFVGIPGMRAGVHQMRIGWGLESADGQPAANTAYFTPWELLAFNPQQEGFGDIRVDLTPRQTAAVAKVKPTVEEGAKLYQMIGCMACHSTDGSTVGKVGPSWKGLFGSDRQLAKGGKSAVADEAYLRESITDPSAKVVKGFEKFDTGMPIYAGILNESQIESLVLYIKTLK